MRAANLTYNNITLSLVHTNQILGEPVYSQDGADYLYTKFTIDVDAILNPEETSYASGSFPFEDEGKLPNETYVAIRHWLMQPGGLLVFRNFGLHVFYSPEQGAVRDANLGPYPKRFTVTRVDGGKLWKVNYVIETYIAECPFNNSIALLSNRFSQSHTVDGDFYTTIVTRGYAHFRMDVLTATNQVADAFRSQLLPPIAPQFKRETMDFGVNTMGNTIEYTIIDREVKLDLGDTGATGSGTFITKMEGFYNLSSVQGVTDQSGGESVPTGASMATMNVKLWGSPQASNWDLTQIAFGTMIGSGKVQLGIIDGQGGLLQHFSITQSLHENFVDLTLSVKQTPRKVSEFGGYDTRGLKVDSVVPFYGGVCPSPPNDNMTRGAQSVMLISSLSTELKQACSEPTKPLAAGGGGGMAPPDYQGPPPAITVYPTNRIPSKSNRYSQSTTEYPYAESKIDSYYESNKGRWHVPSSGKRQYSGSPGGGEEEPPPSQTETTSSVISLHLPITRRIVKWSCERYGAKPKIPAFESTNSALKLLDYTINMAEVIVGQDGVTPIIRVTGKYVYAVAREFATFDKVSFDIPQFIDYPYGSITLDLPSYGTAQGGDFSGGITGES